MTDAQASPRSLHVRDLAEPVTIPALPGGLALRPIESGDDAALGWLMERAYAGTIDEDLGDNDDGEVEVADWRGSGAVPEASFVAVDATGTPLSACLVSRDVDRALWIGYVITDPPAKGTGLATAVVAASLAALRETDSHEQVFAGVTDGNTPSERLLRRAGFQRAHAL